MNQITKQQEKEKDLSNLFSPISQNNYFYLSNGQVIKSITELPSLLENTNETIFNTHVTAYKNDFAKWVYDVFKIEDLSKKLGKIKSKDETIRVLRAYIKQQENTKQSNISLLNSQKEEAGYIKNAQEQILKTETKPLIPQNKETEEKEITKSHNETQKKNRIYVWRTSQSEVYELKKNKPLQQEIKQEIENPEQKKDEEKQSEKKEKNPENKKEEYAIDKKEKLLKLKEDPNIKISSADEFFKKNPVLVSQMIDAKKDTMVFESIDSISIDETNSPKELIEVFKDTYAKAYQKMSLLRKTGFDTSLIEMMLFRVLPKIKLFEASNESKDALTVTRYLNEAIEELNNMNH